jgi:hypothetical protein
MYSRVRKQQIKGKNEMATFTKNYQVQPNEAQKATMKRAFFAIAIHAVNVNNSDVVANTWIENDKFCCDLVVNNELKASLQLGVRGGMLRIPKNEK